MYTSAWLLIWSSIAGHFSFRTMLIGLLVTGVVAIRCMTEEQLLRARYPDYAEYSRKTKRIIPFVI